MNATDYLYIDDDAGLAQLCTELSGAGYCTIDTEFVRESTYYAELALIQVASNDLLACIDPLKINDLAPLTRLLVDPGLLKVFHSPSQDLEILFQRLGEVPSPVFDTQLAAAVLGYNHQLSYADLVLDITGIQLEKKYTRSNWMRRPLSADEIEYALDDVRYLMEVYRVLEQRLLETRRREWIERDLQAMSEPQNYQVDESRLWQRLRGVQKLKGVRLQIVSDLCRWRENLARERNRPRRWIVKDEVLIEIARQQPSSADELGRIAELPDKTAGQHGQALLDIVARAQQVNPEDWPRHDRQETPGSRELALGDCLMALCRKIADDNNIALATLATRKDIDSLILNRKSSRLAQGWRFAMAGEQLLEFLHGQAAIEVDGDNLRLSPTAGVS